MNRLFFWVHGRVLQGDPLSGSPFVCVMELFLGAFNKVFVHISDGVIYACADYLGSGIIVLRACPGCNARRL